MTSSEHLTCKSVCVSWRGIWESCKDSGGPCVGLSRPELIWSICLEVATDIQMFIYYSGCVKNKEVKRKKQERIMQRKEEKKGKGRWGKKKEENKKKKEKGKIKKEKREAVKILFSRAAMSDPSWGASGQARRRLCPTWGKPVETCTPWPWGSSGAAVALSQLKLTRDFSEFYWAENILLRLNILNQLQQISTHSPVTWALLKGSYGSY